MLLGALVIPVCAEAQRSASLPQPELTKARTRTTPATASKTELANRFQEIKTQYAAVKTAAAKFSPLKPDSALELRVTRAKIGAAIRSYDLHEAQTQKQRDKLNLLTELSEMESVRLQMAMDRLNKMGSTISNLMKKINETGDSLVASR